MNYLLLSVIALAPLYVWRFNLFGLPANFLLVLSGLVILLFFANLAYTKRLRDFIEQLTTINRVVVGLIVGFAIASVIALGVSGFNTANLGQWLVLYALPLTFASAIFYQASTDKKFTQQLTVLLYIFVAIAGSLAIIQYLTLWTVPESWWGNSEEPKRAISFFAHPNAFALYLTPLLAWLFANLAEKLTDLKRNWVWLVLWSLGAIGLFLSLSRGAWIALSSAILLYAIVRASKKTLLAGLIGVVVVSLVVFSVPNLRYRVLLPFQGEKSTVARFSLWDTGWKMVSDSPLLGQGVNGFNNNWDKFNTDPNLEHYNFPHNIILNFWVDSGLLGLISFVSLNLFILYLAWIKRKDSWLSAGLILFIFAIFLHGLIDIPYFKNDLALLYWTVVAIGLPIVSFKSNSLQDYEKVS